MRDSLHFHHSHKLEMESLIQIIASIASNRATYSTNSTSWCIFHAIISTWIFSYPNTSDFADAHLTVAANFWLTFQLARTATRSNFFSPSFTWIFIARLAKGMQYFFRPHKKLKRNFIVGKQIFNLKKMHTLSFCLLAYYYFFRSIILTESTQFK